MVVLGSRERHLNALGLDNFAVGPLAKSAPAGLPKTRTRLPDTTFFAELRRRMLDNAKIKLEITRVTSPTRPAPKTGRPGHRTGNLSPALGRPGRRDSR